MSWKIGDTGWICGSESYGVSEFKEPVQVKVIGVMPGDLHPLKVVTAHGATLYVSEKEIQTRQAKAKRKPASLLVTEEVKEKAAKMAEKRMEEIMENTKPKFCDVAEVFDAMSRLRSQHPEDEGYQVLIKLAGDRLYEMIKDGVSR